MRFSHTRSFFVPPDTLQKTPSGVFQDLFIPLKQAFDLDDDIKSAQASLKALLAPSSIQAFVAFYFNSIHTESLAYFEWSASKPPPPIDGKDYGAIKATFTTSQEYKDPKERVTPKLKDQHPLTEDEYKKAYDYLRNNDHYSATFFMMNDIMAAYTYALNTAFKRLLLSNNFNTPQVIQIDSMIDALTEGVNANPFRTESLPVTALEIVQSESESKGLSSALNRHASKNTNVMASVAIVEDDDGSILDDVMVECPFRQAYGHFMNVALGYDEDGNAELREGLEQFGLLKFTTSFLAQHNIIKMPTTGVFNNHIPQ